ncbi:allophanate hydrolase subunit 1 [Rathayibacter sp. YIM 133350]|uniref:5-oxoprolinase subunit B family protein n=1 Tax=Rathayibacter sp. YIM 133350 TaxID=3131992 RepID=UPI00307DFF97
MSSARGLRFLDAGDRALLVELEGIDAVLALRGALAASAPAGVVDMVPAARTVLVTVDPARIRLSEVQRWVERAAASQVEGEAASGAEVELAVRYDGADLVDAAREVGLSVDELVAAHESARWTVAFSGFAPGFGYLVSGDWTFDVPRRASPRTAVPAGAVALAAAFSGVYPRESPGGWQLIGTTDAVLWSVAADPPALLAPGTVVRFRGVG